MHLLADAITLPIGWILSSIGILCGTIVTLTTTFYQFLKSRLAAQDKILAMQDSQIGLLKGEINRMSHGCGMAECHWKFRPRIDI